MDIFLTTNYDYAFYNSDKDVVIDFDGTEKIYSVRRWKKICTEGKSFWLYFIHGDVRGTASIMLGLDHYGGALAKVQDYVKGNYQIKSKDCNKYRQVPSIRMRLDRNVKISPSEYGFKDSGSGLVSWIDAFFFTNLHIIGITLDFSEIDIWWLLSRRARLRRSDLIKNKIYYYPTFPISEIHRHLSKLRLLERLDVQIVYHRSIEDIETGKIDFPFIYDSQIENLKKNL